MFSRILWIGLTAIALVGGLAWQGVFLWDHNADQLAAKRIEARIDAAIDRNYDEMQVVGEDGDAVDVPRETKQSFANALRRFIKSETELALLRVRDSGDKKIDAAEARRDAAKADLDALKNQIEREEDARHVVRDQIRADVRETVRDAVRN